MHEQLKRLAAMATLAAMYFVAARLGLLPVFADSNASPVWPASGLAFAAIFLFGNRLWPGIAAGAFAANFSVLAASDAGMDAGIACLVIAIGNTLEALLGAWLLKRLAGSEMPFAQLQNMYKFAIVAVLACALGAGFGAGALVATGIAPAASLWTIMLTWWTGDVVGVVVVAPVFMAWHSCRRPNCRPRLALEMLVSLLLLAGLIVLIFGQRFAPDGALRALVYVFIPCIGWSAYRHGLRGASLVCLLVAAGAIWGAVHGLGPFAVGTLNGSLMGSASFIGLCSFIGLVLSADMSERRRQRQTKAGGYIIAHWATLFVCVGLAVFLWSLVASATERHARERFDVLAANIPQRILRRMETYEQALRSAQSLFKASQSVERDEWREFIAGMAVNKNFPGIVGIGYAQIVAPAGKSAFEEGIRAQGLPVFHIWPEGGRLPIQTPITFLEPPTNPRAFGYDMYSEPVRRAAMDQARKSGNPALSGKVTMLMRSSKVEAGFLMYLPVYRNGAPIRTMEQRQEALQGYVFSPFRVNDLMQVILRNSFTEVNLKIFDGNETADQSRLYSSVSRTDQERRSYPNPFFEQKMVELGGHQWTIQVTSLAAFENGVDRQKPQIVLITGALISLLFFGFVRALTARREYAVALASEMTAALKQSEKKFESLVESAGEFSIIATGLDGTISVFSVGSEHMLGYGAHEMVGRQPLAFVHLAQEVAARATELSAQLGRTVEGFDVFVERARQGHAESREWTYVRKDGSLLPVNLVMSAIRDSAGRATGFLGVANDITRQRQLQSSLIDAKELAEAASRAKSEFVANMSHEIRTPMNAVLGMAHLLGNTALSADQKKYLDMIRVSGQSLLNILNDILDFSKVEAGRMELSPTRFRLGDVLDALATIMTVNAGEKDLELTIGIEPDVPRTLIGDALRLQQVLVNLVGNAIKFTEQGEVSVQVELAGRQGDTVQLRFCVRDSGIGMDAGQQERLFSAFSQADASITRRFGGTGLGLAICRRLVELMGGSIDVSSALGRGSEFSVTLPLAACGADDASRPQASLGDLRLLVVDDNQTSRDCLCKAIQAWRWQADSAESGAQAIELMRSQEAAGACYDLVLADFQMPGMDGLATMQALRALPQCAALPVVIMVSAFGRGKLMQEAAAAQAAAILIKPVTASSLFDTLHEALALRGAAKASPFEPRPRPDGHRIDGARVLLVEDNPFNQIVARGMLEQAGATVDAVDNGRKAVELLRTDAQRYDLVLMDVQMPVMDGFAATRMIRDELGLGLPVLAMTAGVMASEHEQCMAAGMNDFIGKPIDVAQMFAVIARHLPPQRAGAAPHSPPLVSEPQESGDTFNPARLLEFGKDNPAYRSTLLELIGNMAEHAPDQVREARLAWNEGRIEDAARLFHTMRGSIGTLGAKRFAAAALELETAILANQGGCVASLFEAAQRELQATVAAARLWLGQQPESDAGCAGAETAAPDSAQIESMKDLLARQDLEACDAYAALRPWLRGRLGHEASAALDSAMDRLDFKEALRLVAQISVAPV